MYIFESHTHEKNALVLFMGQYDADSKTGLLSEIQKSYDTNLTPELICFVYPHYLTGNVKELLKDENFSIDLKRYGKTPIIFVCFNEYGEMGCEIAGFGENNIDCEVNFKKLAFDIVKSGYENLMVGRSLDVLVQSPSGTIFSKPSGKTLEEFIYASQLARSSCENQFLAMTLLKYYPKSYSIDHIYIDTAGISAIAEALIYYISKFGNKSCKHIKYSSYSSYSGLEECRPSNADGAWVVISASASTSMGKRIVNKWNIKPEQIVTILSYENPLSDSDTNKGNAVAFSVEEYSNRDKEVRSPIMVQVQGENFTAEISTPKQVLLRKIHKPKFVDDFVYKFREGGVFSVNRDSRYLHIDYLKFKSKYFNDDSNNELKTWMKQVATWSIPKNLAAIVIGSQPDERDFYEDFKSVLIDCGFDFGEDGISMLHGDDHDGLEKIKNGAVLILSPVITSGNYFVDINRSLRLANHNGMRIFATAFVTAPSKAQNERFKKSLTFATNGFSYGFYSYKTGSFGRKNNSTWDKEKSFIKDIIDHNEEEQDGLEYWVKRKGYLEKTGTGIDGLLGLAYDCASDKLELTRDFAFWPPDYKDSEKYDLEAVYATVSSVLQNLRENDLGGDSLKSNIYQHSVLAPENLVRFNDSVLQSCLWRCATPSELDYRRSDDISTDFQRVLSKILKSADLNSSRGKVSLDLLMAISLRWIKLADNALFKIIDDAEENLTKPHAKLLIKEMKSVLEIDKKKEKLNMSSSRVS